MNNLDYQLDPSCWQKKKKHFDNHNSLMVLGFSFAMWILLASFMIFTENGYVYLNLNLFPLFLFGGGLICTIFYQKNKIKKSDPFSLVTISTKNTFVNKWFLSAIIYPVVIALLFWSYSIFADELFRYTSGEIVSTFNPCKGWSATYIQIYFMLQVFYLVGFLVIQKIFSWIKPLWSFLKSIFSIINCMPIKTPYHE